jgi:uncharacterized protein VirK/YbjX
MYARKKFVFDRLSVFENRMLRIFGQKRHEETRGTLPSSGMSCPVDLVKPYVSEERIASNIRLTRLCEHIVFLHSLLRLLITANVVPRSSILLIMKK